MQEILRLQVSKQRKTQGMLHDIVWVNSTARPYLALPHWRAEKTELQRGEVTLPVTAGLPNPALTLQLKKVPGRDGK